MAGRIIRHEFVGSGLRFWLLAILGITLPFAILYLIDCTVRIDEELDDPTGVLDAWRRGDA